MPSGEGKEDARGYIFAVNGREDDGNVMGGAAVCPKRNCSIMGPILLLGSMLIAHGKKNFVLVIERSNDLISGQGTIGGIVGHPVLCQFLFLRFLQALNDEGRNIAENSTCKKIVRN